MVYRRTVYLGDTDAAGVIYFASLLSICHEAYEDSLRRGGIDLQSWIVSGELALPIKSASVDFFRPMVCGQELLVFLQGQQLKESSFQITYQVKGDEGVLLAQGETKHVAIAPTTRIKVSLPPSILAWLESCSS